MEPGLLLIFHQEKCIGCKWIFLIKHKDNGSVERFKAHLVAKGFIQFYSIDYQETFAPVAKLNTIRVLLLPCRESRVPLFQLDVKNVFLNRELLEKVKGPNPSFLFLTRGTLPALLRIKKKTNLSFRLNLFKSESVERTHL